MKNKIDIKEEMKKFTQGFGYKAKPINKEVEEIGKILGIKFNPTQVKKKLTEGEKNVAKAIITLANYVKKENWKDGKTYSCMGQSLSCKNCQMLILLGLLSDVGTDVLTDF